VRPLVAAERLRAAIPDVPSVRLADELPLGVALPDLVQLGDVASADPPSYAVRCLSSTQSRRLGLLKGTLATFGEVRVLTPEGVSNSRHLSAKFNAPLLDFSQLHPTVPQPTH
jgi:hypothetical protein